MSPPNWKATSFSRGPIKNHFIQIRKVNGTEVWGCLNWQNYPLIQSVCPINKVLIPVFSSPNPNSESSSRLQQFRFTYREFRTQAPDFHSFNTHRHQIYAVSRRESAVMRWRKISLIWLLTEENISNPFFIPWAPPLSFPRFDFSLSFNYLFVSIIFFFLCVRFCSLFGFRNIPSMSFFRKTCVNNIFQLQNSYH